MKRIIALVLVLSLLALTNAYAGSGKGIAPGWVSKNLAPSSISAYQVTNITSHTLVVTFTPTKIDGTVVPNSQVGLWTDTTSNAQQSTLDLGPGKSCWFEIRAPGLDSGPSDTGMLTIDWKNKFDNENDYKGLVATGFRFGNSSTTGSYPISWTYALPVSGGMPF